MTGDAEGMLGELDGPSTDVVAPTATAPPARRFGWAGLRAAVPTPRRTPFTFGYLVLLLGTTAFLTYGNSRLTHRLLELSSTDAYNLARRPLEALLTSAFWLDGESWLPYVLIFAMLVAPLERRVGSLRTAAVFFAGHVFATLVTEVPILWLIRTGTLPRTDGHWLDIGVSYGFFTTAGALAFLLPWRRRLLALLGVELFILGLWVSDAPGSMESVLTTAGHVLAAHFGLFACGPWLRRRLNRHR